MLGWLFPSSRIDRRFARLLGGAKLSSFRVLGRNFPIYRFVDVFRAVDRLAEHFDTHHRIDTENSLDLNSIINGRFYGPYQAATSIPTKVPRDVAFQKEEFFPTDQFWVISGPLPDDLPREEGSGHGTIRAILRVKLSEYTQEVQLEIAADNSEAAEMLVEEIVRDSIANSIYRNKLLQISFEAGVKDEYGDVDAPGQIHFAFRQERAVTREEIVLDEEIGEILERNIFSFHRQRETLKEFGVPLKKGVLFYGPPGTGKTYTCQYIYGALKPITTLIVTGQSLLQVKSICNLARMLQPSLLVLEDVDLIFTSREINLYSTALGDLMDEMDGFQKDESVMFLLTTNAIGRLEEAIKDRPGRINQCIYFGHPNAELRGRYISRYLQPYDASRVDLDRVVELTAGSSQAFIKEMIFRAVQISLEDAHRVDAESNGEQVHLANPHFEIAHTEMTRHGERATGRIMGFHVGE